MLEDITKWTHLKGYLYVDPILRHSKYFLFPKLI